MTPRARTKLAAREEEKKSNSSRRSSSPWGDKSPRRINDSAVSHPLPRVTLASSLPIDVIAHRREREREREYFAKQQCPSSSRCKKYLIISLSWAGGCYSADTWRNLFRAAPGGAAACTYKTTLSICFRFIIVSCCTLWKIKWNVLLALSEISKLVLLFLFFQFNFYGL